jgi:hypothetical protein
MPKSTSGASEMLSVAAVQPMTGGSAPGIAPISVASDVRRFNGV